MALTLRNTMLGAAFAVGTAFATQPAHAVTTPVLEYSFPASYDGTDPAVTDLSGAGNDATMDLLGGLVDDRPAGFDSSLMSLTGSTGGHGATTAIDLLDNSLVAAAGGFTMDVWFNWEGTFTDVRKLIDYAGTEHLSTSNSEVRFTIGDGTGILTFGIQANTWYHAVAVFDSEGNSVDGNGDLAGTMYLYIDDNLVGSTAATKTGFGDSLDRPISINRWAGGGADWNQGMIFNPSVSLGVVPEPGSLALLGLGGLAILRRRRPISS